jgi:hypothetical protein
MARRGGFSVPGVDRLLNALPFPRGARRSGERRRHVRGGADRGASPATAHRARGGARSRGRRDAGARQIPRALAHLELWLGRIEYGWGATASDLAPLFRSPGLPALRHLTIVSDLGEALIDELAESALLSGLSTLDLSHGVLGDRGAARLRDHFPRFAHLDRLTLTGNAITRSVAAALRDLGAKRSSLDVNARRTPRRSASTHPWSHCSRTGSRPRPNERLLPTGS